MPVVNDFLVGADPEFVLLDPPHLVNVQQRPLNRAGEKRFIYGFDHAGYVLEPHPDPDYSARKIVKNIRCGLNQIARVLKDDTLKWRAGAYVQAAERNIALGGHIHIDKQRCPVGAGVAYDRFTDFLQRLNILPKLECEARQRNTEYGKLGDFRHERGRYEYRSMCSWLFSQKTAMLCLTGIKLITAAPLSFPDKPLLTSIRDLEKWVELFKGKDDDADWMLEREYFKDGLEARPDRDIKSIWRVDPENMEIPEGFIPGVPADWRDQLRHLPRGERALQMIDRDVRDGQVLTHDQFRAYQGWAARAM